jgi:hypothetical protein
MATKYGIEATKIYNQVPTESVSLGSLGGVVRLHYDKYTFSADLASADVIKMNGLLPKGALIIDAMIKHADLDTSGGTIDFGYAASADGLESADENAFFEAIDVATAADVVMAHNNAASPDGIGKRLAASVQPQLKIEGDTDVTSGSIETFIWYVID